MFLLLGAGLLSAEGSSPGIPRAPHPPWLMIKRRGRARAALQTRLPSVFRQLNTSMAVSQMSAVQCRLAPLIQVIQDCSHLYHYSVKLMFKLHSCESRECLCAGVFPGWAFGAGDEAAVDRGIHCHDPVSQLGSRGLLHPTQTFQIKELEGLVLD